MMSRYRRKLVAVNLRYVARSACTVALAFLGTTAALSPAHAAGPVLPVPGIRAAAPLIVPGVYECTMSSPYQATRVVIKGNTYRQSYLDGSAIGKGTIRPAPDVPAQRGGKTVWFKGGGFGGFPGEFIRKGTIDALGVPLPTNEIWVFASPGGFAAVVCRPK